MKLEDIKKISVIGAGNMGHQIAIQCALKGYDTVCMDINKDILDKAEKFFKEYIPGRIKKGKITSEEGEAVQKRIKFTSDINQAVAKADFVIEAVIEVLEVKRQIFKQIDEIAPEHAILATNSSYIVSSKIADITKRPEKVCNMHFFNPALVMKLVEVVKGKHVSTNTANITYELAVKLDKIPVMLNKEVEGFLLNRILRAIRSEAYWLYQMGIASFEDIDKACIYGAGHPMGPFRLNDLTGLDLSYIQAIEKFKRTGDKNDLPYPILVEKYFQGKFGKKVNEGWYRY